MSQNLQEESNRKSDVEALERFILNNPELEKLEDLLSEFNIFETLNIVDAEIRHSIVLAWLLNPNSNHGLGGYFTRKFLKYLISNNKEALDASISLFDFETFDIATLEIRREWQNIDLLIILEDAKYVIAIENKIGSSEHSDQLARYRKITETEFREFKKIFVYLTPDEATPKEDTEWITFNYWIIVNLLEDVLKYKVNTINEHVFNFISHYVAVLRRHIVGESEVDKICKQIYKQHQQALDIIFQHKPDVLSDVSEYLDSKISGLKGVLVSDSTSKSYIRFTTPVLDNIIEKISEGWTPSRRILLFEIENFKDRLYLKLLIGPGDQSYRKRLLELFRIEPGFFRRSKLELKKMWHSVYTKELLVKKDYEGKEISEIKEKLDKKFTEFITGDLIKINSFFQDNWKR